MALDRLLFFACTTFDWIRHLLSQLDANGSVDLARNAAKMNASLSVTTDTKVLRDSIAERKKTSTSQTINVPLMPWHCCLEQ